MLFKRFLHKLLYLYSILTNPLLKLQRRDPFTIPVIIINFNQLATLKILVTDLRKYGFTNIIIIDNDSTYPPLLSYYTEIVSSSNAKVIFKNQNAGHKVFFNSPDLIQKYAPGYYFLTDPDIILNPDLPSDFPYIMLKHLDKYFSQITKVGFALQIDDLPFKLRNRDTILRIEQGYYAHELEKNVFLAETDTTFALYKPAYPMKNYNIGFYKGVRVAGNFTARHEGWYVDVDNMTPEQEYYYNNSDPAIHSSK